MNPSISRRSALAAGLALPLIVVARRRTRKDRGGELVARLRAASEREAYEVAAGAMAGGETPEALLGAVLHAALLDIPPSPLGGPLHAAMVVESAFQLSEDAPALERRLAALWCLGDYLRYRGRVRAEGEWELGAPPSVEFDDGEQGRQELVAGLLGWDAERAERAVVGLLETVPAPVVFEVLRPYAARCFAGFGHKLLYAVQLERVLERLDPSVAQPALRSLAICLVHPDHAPETATWGSAQELARELPPGWERGREDPAESLVLMSALDGKSASEAQALAAAAVREGLGPETIWNGLRLFASDLFQRRAAAARQRHLPVHTVTETNAFDSSRRRTGDAGLRSELLLQAAGWLSLLRAAVEEQSGPSREGDGLLTLEVETARAPRTGDLLRAATQDHHLKYAAAAIEEARRAPAPHGARILAATTSYLPDPGAQESELHRRSLAALRSAGPR